MDEANGNRYAYRINVTNKTNRTAKGFEVYVKIPAGVKYVSGYGIAGEIKGEYLVITCTLSWLDFKPNKLETGFAGFTLELSDGVTMPETFEYTSKAIYE